MKYASIYSKSRISNRKNNIGETIIDIAMDEIYQYMGISQTSIVRINKPDISSYDGEKVILPVVKGYPQCHSISKAFSENVIPVFLCWSLLDGAINPEDVSWLKAHEPIGCRDEHTLNECLRKGIRAYLNGCITICFPRLEQYNKNGKVYLVDIQPELESYIPDKLKQKAVRVTHLIPEGELRKDAKRLLEQYADSARLVITSRLHAAIPCMAMGIPVIFCKNDFPSRYTWCDRFIPVYDKPQYGKIDWNPQPAELEEYKEMMKELIAVRLRAVFEMETTCRRIHNFYCGRPKRKGVTSLSKTIPLIEKAVEKYGRDFQYSLWGVSVLAESFYQYISEYYPEARLIHVYDKYRKLDFHGLATEPAEHILRQEYAFLIACPMLDTIMQEMKDFLKRTGRPEDSYMMASPVT